MADVQLKHGFTMIADALLEAICRAPVPGRHHRVFAALIRLTYGYQKRVDRIATSQVAALTGIDRRSVTRILQDLETAGMIARGPFEPGRSRRIAIVKDHERWEPGPTSGVNGDPSRGDSPTGARDPSCGDLGSGRADPCVDPPTGAHDPGGVAPETPLVGSPAPPTIKKERLTKESAAPAAPLPLSSNLRKVKVNRPCPDRLEPQERVEVVAWCAAEHPGKFSNVELAAQWDRFRKARSTRKTRDDDWVARFQSWLTGEYYRPLTSGGGGAPAKIYRASREPPPELDAEEWAACQAECEKIRERAGFTRKVGSPPARLATGRDRYVTL